MTLKYREKYATLDGVRKGELFNEVVCELEEALRSIDNMKLECDNFNNIGKMFSDDEISCKTIETLVYELIKDNDSLLSQLSTQGDIADANEREDTRLNIRCALMNKSLNALQDKELLLLEIINNLSKGLHNK